MELREAELRAAVIAASGGASVPLSDLRTRLGVPWDRPVGRDALDRLLQLDTTFLEVSAGFVHMPALLEGTAWAVRIDADDAAEGFVRMHPDLSVLGWWLIGGEVAVVDETGRPVGILETDGWLLDGEDTDVVLGPDGWLDGLVGGWARVDVVGGATRWTALDGPPAATPAQVTAMRAGFERAVDAAEEERYVGVSAPPPGLRFVAGSQAIDEALLVDPVAFRTDLIPPAADLYAAAGLVLRGPSVAREGFDWEALHAWQDRNRLRLSYPRLTAEQVDRVASFVAEAAASTGDAATAVTGAALAALDDGAVAAAAWEVLEVRGVPSAALAVLAAPAGDGVSIGHAWLRSRLLDRAGDVVAAVEVLESAVGPDCVHVPALVDLAGLRADRGDAAGARRLLAQAAIRPDDDEDEEQDDDPGPALWREVDQYASNRPRPTARRNDPCPCGSGRKYKACHLGRESHSLDDRAAWLYLKAQRFLRDRQPDAAEELAEMVVDVVDDDELFDQLLDSPFLDDVVLHEDGVFAEFLSARDVLLPDDEALLAAQWALVDRAVFEVLGVGATQLELRDVTSGDRIRVVNVHPSDRTRPGLLVVGRPLPVGDSHRAFSGFIPLDPRHQERMLAAIDAGDAEALADALAVIVAPARLANTDGHDLVPHAITWRVPRPDDVAAALAAAGLQADGVGEWTLVRDTERQDDTIVAAVSLAGDELTAEVNSAERAAAVQLLIAEALPDALITDVDIQAFGMSDGPGGAPGPSPSDPMGDPAIRAVLAEHVANYERRWLDEPIPALHGRTPRQAAADPIGREELTRLLASFPEPGEDDAGAMDPRRLRAALDL